MKVGYRILLLICVFFLMRPLPALGQAKDYDGEQILLSWSDGISHSQTITWHSASKKEGYVQYNESDKPLSNRFQVKARLTKVGKTEYYRYEAVIKGLRQKTTYDYRIGDGEHWSKVRSFTTAPAAKPDAAESGTEDSTEFLYFGDVQYQDRYGDYKTWGKLAEDIRRRHPGISFALSGGDMVNSGGKMKEWELFLQSAEPVFSYIPLMPAIGNHETSTKATKADAYLRLMALPENGPQGLEEEFYSFDYANCHITVMNSCFFEEARRAAEQDSWKEELEQVDRWLEEDLVQSKAKWKLLVMHHPAYGISDGDPIYDEIRQQWEPIFEMGKVDLVFCGHQHLYMRTKEMGGITYIMGNSGKRRSTYFDGENVPDYIKAIDATNSNYQIVKASEKELSVTSYDEEGQIIDKWTKCKDDFSWLLAGAAGLSIMHILALGGFLALKKKKRKKGTVSSY